MKPIHVIKVPKGIDFSSSKARVNKEEPVMNIKSIVTEKNRHI